MVGAVKRFEERRMRNGFFVSNDAVRNLVVSCPQFTFMQLAVLDHGYCAVVWFCLSCFVSVAVENARKKTESRSLIIGLHHATSPV